MYVNTLTRHAPSPHTCRQENGVDEAWTLAPAGEEQAREAG